MHFPQYFSFFRPPIEKCTDTIASCPKFLPAIGCLLLNAMYGAAHSTAQPAGGGTNERNVQMEARALLRHATVLPGSNSRPRFDEEAVSTKWGAAQSDDEKPEVRRPAGSIALKRALDLMLATLLLMFLAPGLIAVATAIKATSRGPVLFRQRRYGLNDTEFEIFKFRTMYVERSDCSGVTQTRANDPRVTPLGRLLRRTSIDELPQLLNVLMGDMSLVGPRPHVPGMRAGGVLYEELVPYYFERHKVRPGLTGLAQVNGLRGSTEDPVRAIARIDHDLAYIAQCSPALDLYILWETLRSEFLSGSGI
jgi:polysaccharide biosynthesis protein PslA